MSVKNKDILCKVANLVGKNPYIDNTIKQICLEWSDKKYNTLFETYEYLKNKKPNDIYTCISALEYMVCVSN